MHRSPFEKLARKLASMGKSMFCRVCRWTHSLAIWQRGNSVGAHRVCKRQHHRFDVFVNRMIRFVWSLNFRIHQQQQQQAQKRMTQRHCIGIYYVFDASSLLQSSFQLNSIRLRLRRLLFEPLFHQLFNRCNQCTSEWKQCFSQTKPKGHHASIIAPSSISSNNYRIALNFEFISAP